MSRNCVLLFLVSVTSCVTYCEANAVNNVTSPIPECDPVTEVLDSCPSGYCPTDHCPGVHISTESVDCQPQSPCREAVCKCRFNYLRNETLNCVSAYECPPLQCPEPNEEYHPCPPACPADDCATATSTIPCPLMLFVLQCTPKCRCVEGTFRNKNGSCVSSQDCLEDLKPMDVIVKQP